ncbi:L-aspartate oxidase [Ureibacillus acetophenoni]|uniref:L-aspartate oxidase n=1 Tax=Ureibacillus acetophenoni TaxID=614649 RepID=A0A285U3K0_9BACL|nr:L-aspartate oxidase [Ureibacillus acetophenoni]SOC36524.1 L-aspartate oxidase [Ureibacillus acetophenoni]
MIIETDIVIIGSGVAALQSAKALSKNFNVHIITKAEITNGSSYKAQGGIAAVMSSDDQTQLHINDTLVAGEHHHSLENVKTLVEEGKNAIHQLIDEHFPVDRKDNGDISLGLEGAHSMPRIVHSGGDATGKVLIDYLLKVLPKNVQIHDFEMAFELILNNHSECIGVKTKTSNDDINTYFASYIILATGGAGALYASTSNSPNSFGDGIALAFLAGAKISDMEFIQFHPSLLYVKGLSRGLVSEAVRGAGGQFVDENGQKIMEGKHPLGDLAPRHITAFEMYKERAKGNEVYIDISMIDHFEEQFPTITQLCKDNGVSITEGRIPIAPGSHFIMGGVVADSFGRTSIPRLLAVGEVACTGVHGANRLASNSLLEGITFGKLMAEHLIQNGTRQKNFQPVKNITSFNVKSFTLLPIEELQNEMLAKSGILRDSEGLQELIHQLPSFEQFFKVDFDNLKQEKIEQIFMHITSSLIANAAFVRTESRGAHIRKDYGDLSNDWQNKWIVFENGKMNVRGGLYEFDQTSRHVKAIF